MENDKKVLILTSIYTKLWGTKLGGRPSREIHYKLSLLNILNIAASRFVCFTSKDEYDELCDFYYVKNNIDRELLEIVVFDLTKTKYYDLIDQKKDAEKMKTFDRCFEIQYNKFFWFELIKDVDKYDRVYWIDAGLSYGALFPEEYRVGNGYEKYFRINLFKPDFLHKINVKTDNKIINLSKNNTGKFYWSQSLPEKYYNDYNKDKHIIGGLFGGKPENYRNYVKLFDNLLKQLLDIEDELYMEEQIMSCLYYNNQNLITTLEFDDWYKRDSHNEHVKYFYNLFL